MPSRIQRFMHCRRCGETRPRHLSMGEWARLEVGLTPSGIQVWCVRHDKEVATFTPAGLAGLFGEPLPPCECCESGVHDETRPRRPRGT